MVIFAASKNKIFKQNELELFCFIISEPILQQIQSKKTRIKLIYHMKRATRKIFFFDEDNSNGEFHFANKKKTNY